MRRGRAVSAVTTALPQMVAVLLIACALVGASATPAAAVDCGNNEQIFVQSTKDRDLIRGTLNRIQMRNRPLDDRCEGALTVSTAHISRDVVGTGCGCWVEIGWKEVWRNVGIEKEWKVFVEKGIDFDSTQSTNIVAPNLEAGTDDLWRISGAPSSGGGESWDLAVNFVIGEGYVAVDTYHTDWLHGFAYGETESFVHDTGMRDDQTNLQFKNNSNDWVSWPGVTCGYDSGPLEQWRWHRIADDQYEVVASTSTDCTG